MEIEVEKVRDQWIDKFKKKWDFHIQSLVLEKNSELKKLQEEYKKIVNDLNKQKVKQIEVINDSYKNKIDKVKNKTESKNKIIIEKHNKRITDFLSSNLKKTTIYDSIWSYLSYLKIILLDRTISYDEEIKIDDEPEIITFKNIPLTEPNSLYPIVQSCSDICDRNIHIENVYISPDNNPVSAPPDYSKYVSEENNLP